MADGEDGLEQTGGPSFPVSYPTGDPTQHHSRRWNSSDSSPPFPITPLFQRLSFTPEDSPPTPPAPPPNTPSMASNRPPSRHQPASLSHVRRNLFHPNLSRRPTSATSTSTSATTQLLDSPPTDSTTSEIVVRDSNGNYAIQLPTLPPEEDEEGQEQVGAQIEGEAGWEPKVGKRGGSSRPSDPEKGLQWASVQLHLEQIERERIRKETDPAELLAAARTSLREAVASLDEDAWMFEADTSHPI